MANESVLLDQYFCVAKMPPDIGIRDASAVENKDGSSKSAGQ